MITSSAPIAGRAPASTSTTTTAIPRRPLPASASASPSTSSQHLPPSSAQAVAAARSSASLSSQARRRRPSEPPPPQAASTDAARQRASAKPLPPPPPSPPSKSSKPGLHPATSAASRDIASKGKTVQRKKLGTERYLLGLGGYDASEYRQYQDSGAEDRRAAAGDKGSAVATMPSGSKSLARSSKASNATQSSIFSQPRDKNNSSVNPAAEAASKSSTVNPAPRLRAGSSSTAPTNGKLRPPPSVPQPVFKHEGGRRWLRDASHAYPLPVDLEELHRQSMRLVLMMRLFAAPFCNKTFLAQLDEAPPPETARGSKMRPPSTPKGGLHGNPPTPRASATKVLEVACGAALWSGACNDYLAHHGHSGVQFVGMDIAPLAPDLNKSGVNWRFVQWDMRQLPWPFDDGEFDFIFLKDVSLCGQAARNSTTPITETTRLLKAGGVVEFWESDYVYRTLLSNPQLPPNTSAEEAEQAEACAAYVINASTPFVPPQNRYFTDANAWIGDALMKRGLSPSPCGMFEWALRVESDRLRDVDSRRIALPFDITRWEREANITLDSAQAALRHTALLTTLQFIMALEPLLSGYSEKRPDEWSRYWTAMMRDLLDNKGAAGGECLEMGAWWAVRC